MKIGLISTCAVATPPFAYGGIERFVATLADGLVANGHDVCVVATGDSRVEGTLRYRFVEPIWPPNDAAEAEHARYAWDALRAFDPDVVHVNRTQALICGRRLDAPIVATIHDEPWPSLARLYARSGAHCVAISRNQTRSLQGVAPLAVIPHGLEIARFRAGTGDGGYAAFLGRVGPEKAPHVAIDAARLAQVPLRIGGPCWAGIARYERYYAQAFAPRLQAGGDVTWLGELDSASKLALLERAKALLFPLEWDEPFGLVMVEAMLVGTPVVAFARGSAPEVVDEGVTGFLVHDVEEMAEAIARASRLDRARCRSQAQRRFSADAMVGQYDALYRALVADGMVWAANGRR